MSRSFPDDPTKHIAKPSWPSNLPWPQFAPVYRHSTTTVFPWRCRKWPTLLLFCIQPYLNSSKRWERGASLTSKLLELNNYSHFEPARPALNPPMSQKNCRICRVFFQLVYIFDACSNITETTNHKTIWESFLVQYRIFPMPYIVTRSHVEKHKTIAICYIENKKWIFFTRLYTYVSM